MEKICLHTQVKIELCGGRGIEIGSYEKYGKEAVMHVAGREGGSTTKWLSKVKTSGTEGGREGAQGGIKESVDLFASGEERWIHLQKEGKKGYRKLSLSPRDTVGKRVCLSCAFLLHVAILCCKQKHYLCTSIADCEMCGSEVSFAG